MSGKILNERAAQTHDDVALHNKLGIYFSLTL